MAEQAPLVTVIVPAFNAAGTLARTLASISGQTWQDFEAIVVDDGSTDATARVFAAVAGDDPRFRLLRQGNAGVSAARNRGLAEARGRFVANLDADDLWRPEFLVRTVAALERNPRAVFSCARSLWIGPDDAVLPLREVRLPVRLGYRELLLRNAVGNGSSVLMRRADVEAIGGWQVGLGHGEDWLLLLQLSWRGEIVPVDEPLVLYRINAASSSHDLESAARGALEVIRQCRLDGPRLPRADYWAARSLAMMWLLRRARSAGRRRLAIWFAAQAYLRNPLWFRLPELRAPFGRLLGGRPAHASAGR